MSTFECVYCKKTVAADGDLPPVEWYGVPHERYDIYCCGVRCLMMYNLKKTNPPIHASLVFLSKLVSEAKACLDIEMEVARLALGRPGEMKELDEKLFFDQHPGLKRLHDVLQTRP